MNTVYLILQQTMFFFIPLMLVSLGGLYSERSGVTNIALEGIMIIGGFVGVLIIKILDGILPGQWLYLAAIAAAALAGVIYSLFHAWSSIHLMADQTISGTALNLFAPAVCMFMARTFFGNKQIPFVDKFFIDKVPVLGDIPFIGPAFFQKAYISTYIGIIILIVFAFILKKTAFGLRLCACGENPNAAAGAGISVEKMRYTGVLLSGALGGAGGIIFIVPSSTSFDSTVAGYGFLALAVLILGQWKPLGIFLASLFFGILKAISSAYSGIPFLADLNIPSEIYKMIPYVLTLVVLAVSAKKSHAPKAVGQPYDTGNRSSGNVKKGKKALRLIIVIGLLIAVTGELVYLGLQSGGARKNSTGYGAEIALLLDASGNIDDNSFVEGEWDGIVEFSNTHDMTRKYYQAQEDSKEGLSRVISLAAKGNAKLIVASSNTFSRAVYETQDLYKDIPIILVDAEPTDEDGNVRIGENVVCLSFAEEESGFLAGYAAVMDGYRSIGYIGGMAMGPVIRYGYGFAAGIEYAAEELKLQEGAIELRYNYAGTFSPNPEALSMASSWYQTGTEVIFACAGSLNSSVMKAAEVNGKYVIGVDADQSGDSPTVITSAMKNVGKGIVSVFDECLGDMGQIGGKALRMTASSNAVGLPMETSRFKQFTVQKYNELYTNIAAGTISIPTELSADSVAKLSLPHVKVTEIN